ncbi:MAG TPA: pirin family protein [Acidimicrobiales bacterium]
MSGPVRTEDADVDAGRGEDVPRPTVEVTPSRTTEVGAITVRRALPRRGRRTVGAWCFADHMGPAQVTEDHGLDIGPHPHIGLQTVTWLIDGAVLHRDSLGSEQEIRPGQLNLMTAGHGVAHAEEPTGRYRGPLQGIQLWVAQPERTRHGPPAFEHHAELPRLDLGAGGTATVLVGAVGDTRSPARHDTPGVGAEVALRPGTTAELPLDPTFEHALVVLVGAVRVDGVAVTPGHLAYLGERRDELALAADPDDGARLLLLGGVPFESPISMWWNFVARTHDEIDAARAAWEAGDESRFAPVASSLPRIPAPPTPWGP